ncbi:MAG: LysM peptidoglycan-binding domain-containing protein [Clostridia bacterium]|nr:LysM peptidoglycan-binding domain-containing protein [Clostridia bacterium]
MKLTKKGKRCLLFVSVTVLMIVFAITQMNAFAKKETTSEYFSYIVQPNDSLWSIAEEFGGDEDIRQTMYEIKKLNQLEGSSLAVGTRLLIACPQ